jgi:hypothetical protein
VTAVETTALTSALAPPIPAVPGAVGAAVPATGGRGAVRTVLWSGLVLAFATTCLLNGLPTDRVLLLGWVLAALAVHAGTDGWRRVGRLLADWLPLAALLLAYDASRGFADGLGMRVHVTEPAAVDRWLGGGLLPTVWLQQHWQADWWSALATLVYSSHFVLTPVLLGVLWVRNRALWGRYARRVVALSAAGLLTYVLYPAAPPWLAARDGVVEPIDRLSGSGWHVLGLPRAGALLADSQGQVNPVAAVPSLHTAFAVLPCLILLPLARRVWQRVVLIGYAVLMPLVLVWSGEHYVVDTLLGALYAAAVSVLLAAAGHALRPVLGRWTPTVAAARAVPRPRTAA